MNFLIENINEIKIITIALKRATIGFADEFKSILISEIDKGEKKIIIDLDDCEFMDSVFFGALVTGLKDIIRVKGEIKICSSMSDAKRMLEHTRATRVFDIYDSREEALKSFKDAR